MIIAVDFDGTIVDHDFPAIGPPKPGAFDVLRALKASGHRLILWTCREDRAQFKYLTDAVEFCRSHGVEFDSVNENRRDDLPMVAHLFDEKPNRKVFADVYIDDRNIGGFPGWDAVADFITGICVGNIEV